MLLKTRNFGEIEIEEEKILDFPDGIPAFEERTKFIILKNPDEEIPFHWLQSVEDENLTFVIVNPFIFRPDYDFEISQSVVEKLGIEAVEDVNLFAIVVVPEDISKMTANLRAPLIINSKNYKAKQIVIEDERYHTKHYILEELNTPQNEKTLEGAK
ncbi:flagellar assembly factor FliW [Anaerovirgula multivorans]|uniref:Flagellar assembly factor FliW n=1 Tax=Anaerovirgula multivorans TaxID=312168 RepID=A0A239EX25_9FIRM|nr:flagellar assembly protein FliW [Anaerovirgula multivorans]SNS49169.1 flagellar assembly factor FliW [Anaerovirgula multivorans]